MHNRESSISCLYPYTRICSCYSYLHAVHGADFSGILANIDDTGPCLAQEALSIDTEHNCTVPTTPDPQDTNKKSMIITVVMTTISSALIITVIVMMIVMYRLCRMHKK